MFLFAFIFQDTVVLGKESGYTEENLSITVQVVIVLPHSFTSTLIPLSFEYWKDSLLNFKEYYMALLSIGSPTSMQYFILQNVFVLAHDWLEHSSKACISKGYGKIFLPSILCQVEIFKLGRLIIEI